MSNIFRLVPFLFMYIFPVIGWAGFVTGAAWMLPVAIFVGVPVLDGFAGLNRENPSGEGGGLYRLLTWLYVPVHLAVLGWGLHDLATVERSLGMQVALTVNLGLLGALAINVAHELMHRAGAWEQGLAVLLMNSTSYTHFCIEHVFGHHRNVATAHDPATARRGENLYAYLPRTLAGGLRSAWHIEVERLGARALPLISVHNRMLRFAALLVATAVGLSLWLGPAGLLFFFGQSLVAVLMLETINYIEHYGLMRRIKADGKPERVMPVHSWNSSHRISNYLLLNLARHSDHHAFAGRRYHELRHYEDVPQFPYGYATMLLLAMVPPLWFRIMEPKLAGWEQQAGLRASA